MNGSCIILLFLLLCCNRKEECDTKPVFVPPNSPCSRREQFGNERNERNVRQEESQFNTGNRVFGPFGNTNTCGCEDKS